MHGILVLDKPEGLSSSKALAPFRRLSLKVGHAGTLDPFASGALLVLLGDGTRLSELAMALPKTYEARVRFGVRTDTLDPEGAVVAEADPGPVPPTELPAVLRRFVGDVEQVPPAFSALKVGGKRAYRLAREGKEPKLAARRVRIDEVTLLEECWPEAVLRVRCGRGTYLRSLARDLGEALGLPASLTALRRTHLGPLAADLGLRLPPETTPEQAEAGLAASAFDLTVLTQAARLPELVLDRRDAARFTSGGTVRLPDAPGFRDAERVAVLWPGGEEGVEVLLGLGEPARDGSLRPRTVLASARAALEQR